MNLSQQNHVEEDFPKAHFIRIRSDHAPKVIMDAPRTSVLINGQIRPAARRCEAMLFRLTDTGDLMPTYYSFGTNIRTDLVGGTSSYRKITKVDSKTDESLQNPWTDTWATPNAIEITILRHPKYSCFHPDDLARLVEALRSEYGHYGGWTKLPAPLHFATFLKEYVPDYELSEEVNEEEPDDEESIEEELD